VPGFQLFMLKKLGFWAHSRAKKLLPYSPTPKKRLLSANPNYQLSIINYPLSINEDSPQY